MIDFPNSPTLNQVFQAPNGVSYTWNGTLWLVQNTFAGGTGDFMATHSALGGVVGGSLATIIWPTVTIGNAGLWYSTSTGRYTPPAGRFCLFTEITGSLTAAASSLQVIIRKNGVTIGDGIVDTAATANNANPSLQAIVDANGTDWFDVQALASAGLTIGNGRFMAFPLTGMQGPMGPSGSMLINGTGAPTGLSAAKGTLYINTTATTTTTRLYINTDGATTWANFTASA
jgi:hypothetical protein